MNIAYAWARHKSKCVVCLQVIQRREGIGILVDAPEDFQSSATKARWAHTRCLVAKEKELRDASKASARLGYALRKGKKATNGATGRPSKTALKYEGKRLPVNKPMQVERGATGASIPVANQFIAYEPDSAYAQREGRLLRIVEEVCDFGVRIDRDSLLSLLDGDASSETVKSVSRFLVGDRVFPKFSVSAITGRVSIKQPNLGSLAKSSERSERSIVLPEPGHVLFSVDLAQVEARVVAGLCQDETYLEQFSPGRDLHAEIAERLLGDRTRRETAKKLVHGINYGIGKRQVADICNITLGDAEAVVRGMAKQFPIWASWVESMVDEGRRLGRLTTVFGRTVPIERSKAHTQSVSRVVQSTARDLFFQRIEVMHMQGLTEHVRLLLHDEVLMSVPEPDFEELSTEVLLCLSHDWQPSPELIRVKIPAVISEPGSSWAATRCSLSKVAA